MTYFERRRARRLAWLLLVLAPVFAGLPGSGVSAEAGDDAAEDAVVSEPPLSWVWVEEGPPKVHLWTIPAGAVLRYEQLPARLRTLFESAGTVIVELDSRPAGVVAAMPHLMRLDGTTFSQAVPAELKERSDKLFRALGGTMRLPMEIMKTATVATFLQGMLTTPTGLASKALLEVLQAKATEAEKKVHWLYSFKDVIRLRARAPEEEQTAFLRRVVERCEHSIREGIDVPAELKNAYLAGDLAALREAWAKVCDPEDLIFDPDLLVQSAERLQALVAAGDDIPEPIVVITAVSTLLEKEGVMEALRARGWNPQPVPLPDPE